MHIPHFSRNNERQGESGRAAGTEAYGRRERESGKRKEEESESERTKCNLSAYSDSQSLKWELTENVGDCSLIGQGHSWHFQAKLQRRRREQMCLNYKLFSPPPALMSTFKKQYSFFSPFQILTIFALSFISTGLSVKIMLTRLAAPTGGWGGIKHTRSMLILNFTPIWTQAATFNFLKIPKSVSPGASDSTAVAVE